MSIYISRLETIFKSLSEIIRLRLMRILCKGDFSVAELADILMIKQSRASRHLNILNRAGLIKRSRDGSKIFYSLNEDDNPVLNDIKKYIINIPVLEFESDIKKIDEIYKKRSSYSEIFFNSINKEALEKLSMFLDRNILTDRIKKHRGSIAVDLGTGNGKFLKDLAKNFSKVIGIDNSYKMLSMAGEVIEKNNLQNASLIMAGLDDLPLDNNSIDFLSAILVLHHISSPIKAIKEMIRVKKSNGRFFIIDFIKHEDENFRTKYADIWLGFDTNLLKKNLMLAGAIEVNFEYFEQSGKKLFICSGY